jgi:hypothetical protein
MPGAGGWVGLRAPERRPEHDCAVDLVEAVDHLCQRLPISVTMNAGSSTVMASFRPYNNISLLSLLLNVRVTLETILTF